MKTIEELMSVENPVFSTFIAWSCLLIIKMMALSSITVIYRIKNKTPATPEDFNMFKMSEMPSPDEDVERTRRAHLNDMENILPFLSVGLFYVLTDPKPMVAIILIHLTTVARFLHTFVYTIYVVPQPARAICFFIHFGITLYMAIMCIIYFI